VEKPCDFSAIREGKFVNVYKDTIVLFSSQTISF